MRQPWTGVSVRIGRSKTTLLKRFMTLSIL